ncbi:transcription initiation factor IIF, beta subunit [Naegleria gruberi]|uniref:Transcription initiation factor IIF, beta subunit n=1 Tax=Naegleria gruberi TaxID=5762 RepID=D2UXQ5_NAEGR|nr:transcription initiation factor IIF, beta subunit [Naegleria gruberi]EFC50328.1 transcription initiation factor IIF, beta subunit [Naegleria gruberi]|eukprot:XP_002683072.1 transcription initiation factor IIF, beta subunit [Naegleria gruberi strain NEG-M]
MSEQLKRKEPSKPTTPAKRYKKQYIPLEGIVDASQADKQQIWLVKIPDFIDLDKYKDEETIGSVIIEKNTTSNSEAKCSLHIEPPAGGEALTVSDFDLIMNKKKTPMYVFGMTKLTEEETQERERLRQRKKSEPLLELKYIDDTKINIAGHIDQSCNAVVKFGQAYGQLSKNRVLQSNQKEKKAVQVAESQSTKKSVNLLDAYRDGKKDDTPRDNRVREDGEKIKAKIFSLYKERQYWKMEELANITDQPTQHVKTILSSICVYNKSGEYKGYYQLKPEYAIDESKKIGTHDLGEEEEWE